MNLKDLTYVLPLKWPERGDVEEMAAYLKGISQICDVIVVDGSDPEIFEEHARSWGTTAEVVAPDDDLRYAMGKVNGTVTGIRRARSDYVVLADDDVRYDEEGLARVRDLLNRVELVRPQNYFDPLPWHAAWDTSRTLLNRSFGADYPGTLGLRKSFFMRLGGTYDGDAIFENLELMRTIEAGGGTIASPLDLYVRRIPPTTRHFWSQRVRQAYDDLAQPPRLFGFLSLLPLALGRSGRRRKFASVVAAGSVLLAELGRRRAGGTRFFPWYTSLLAPAWIGERAVCSWLAVINKVVRGGVPYAGGVVPKAANPKRELRHRLERASLERSRPGI